ncbi:MAG: hypothetical protein LBS60_09140 [Deltaproteobacteria bacterium]|jgi:hypothetical protein|nr:hypothetical protein [Deltaproteobacteria bacterium]
MAKMRKIIVCFLWLSAFIAPIALAISETINFSHETNSSLFVIVYFIFMWIMYSATLGAISIFIAFGTLNYLDKHAEDEDITIFQLKKEEIENKEQKTKKRKASAREDWSKNDSDE